MSMRQQQAQSGMISHSKIPPVYISMATIILDDHENVNLLLFHKPLLIPCLIWSDRVEWRSTTKRAAQGLQSEHCWEKHKHQKGGSQSSNFLQGSDLPLPHLLKNM